MRRPFHALVTTYRAAFHGLPRSVWLVAAAMLVNRSGTMVLPFLSLYVVSWLGRPAADAAWVLAAFGLGSVVGSYLGGRLSSRFGAVRMQQLTLVASGFGFFALSLLRSLDELLIGVFVVSAISDAFRPAAMVAAVEPVPLALRTRALALLRLAGHLGWSIGPALGGLLAAYDYRLLFLGDGLTCWLAALVLWRFAAGRPAAAAGAGQAPPAVVAPPPVLSAASAWRDGPFFALLAMVFVLAAVIFQFTGALPLYLHRVYQLDERAIGLLFGLKSALIVVFEMVVVHRLETRAPMVVFGVGCLITCLSFPLLLLGSSFAWAALILALWSLGEMLSMPFSNFLVTLRAGERPGEHMGLYTATFSCALVVAPPAGLGLYEHFGGTVLWLSVGALGPVLWLASRLLAGFFRRH